MSKLERLYYIQTKDSPKDMSHERAHRSPFTKPLKCACKEGTNITNKFCGLGMMVGVEIVSIHGHDRDQEALIILPSKRQGLRGSQWALFAGGWGSG